MKHTLILSALVGIATVAMVGCSGDTVAPTDINTHFEPKTGDTFTYARYDRDMDNNRVSNSKTIHKWIVLETNLTYEDKNSVAKVLQLNFDETGTVKTRPDDIMYIRSGVDGQIFMDVVSATIKRIPVAVSFADSIPFTWFQISDSKSSNATIYDPLPGGITKDVALPLGAITAELRVGVTGEARHAGKRPTQVQSDSLRLYPNAFHTDHDLRLRAVTKQGLLVIIQDTLRLGYDVDVTNGILRQTMASDTVTLKLSVVGAPDQMQLVPGFEMELINVVRAK